MMLSEANSALTDVKNILLHFFDSVSIIHEKHSYKREGKERAAVSVCASAPETHETLKATWLPADVCLLSRSTLGFCPAPQDRPPHWTRRTSFRCEDRAFSPRYPSPLCSDRTYLVSVTVSFFF